MKHITGAPVSNLGQFFDRADRSLFFFFGDTWHFKLHFYNYTVLLRGILWLLCEQRIKKKFRQKLPCIVPVFVDTD